MGIRASGLKTCPISDSDEGLVDGRRSDSRGIGVIMQQVKSPHRHRNIAFGTQATGSPVIRGQLETSLDGYGNGGCLAVINHAGKFDIQIVFGRIQVNDLDNTLLGVSVRSW
jgi:hypothetical protein